MNGSAAGGTFEPRNRLLAALSPADRATLRPHLEAVPLPHGKVLFDADDSLTRVYFPEDGVVSLVCVFENGTTSEMATVGREGVVGFSALLDEDIAIGRHLVEVPGSALSMPASRFRGVLRQSEALRALCTAHARAFLAQVLYTVACNGVHTVEERCARWLLMTHDRSGGDTFALTQEFLAEMLGVHRPTVTVVARSLQGAGLIRYSRGSITVVDRRGLEEASCECYRVIRRQYERLLPGTFG